jgi:hypothetical protein
MKTQLAMVVGAAPLLMSDALLAQTQTGSMMDGYGGMWGGGWMGGYGGFWGPALLVLVVVGVVAWVVRQKNK